MIERPILFSGPMVRAAMRDVDPKTQTRRVVKPQPPAHAGDGYPRNRVFCNLVDAEEDILYAFGPDDWKVRSPHGVPGDRLWVRENGWERPERSARDMREGADTWARYYYDADGEDGEQLKEWGFKRRPSIHMPRWACRLVLEVTAVRVERLQEISEADAKAEGVSGWDGQILPGSICYADGARGAYRALWDSLNAKRAPWTSNPWVWVIGFRRHV